MRLAINPEKMGGEASNQVMTKIVWMTDGHVLFCKFIGSENGRENESQNKIS